ncbi:MAG TPA: tetratricopeptide repeat protein [Pyrinomonadaceae bacterium]
MIKKHRHPPLLWLPLLLLSPAAFAQGVPRGAEEFYNRGVERLRQKDYAGALADLDRAVALRPDHAESYFQRSFAQDGMARQEKDIAKYGDFRKAARADIDKAVALAPDRAMFYKRRAAYWLTFAVEDEEKDKIIEDLTKAISLDPRDAELLFLRASTLMLKDDFAGALADKDRAIALAPSNAGYYGARARLKLIFLGDYEGAVADASKALGLDDGEFAYETHAVRAKALLALGRKAEAETDFRKCRSLNPRCDAKLERMSELMEEMKRKRKAK